MEETKKTELAVLEKFDGLAFLSKIESAESISKKFKIMNEALDQDVLEIRNIGRTKTLNLIAKDYGVSFQLISNIINRKCWRHI